ncbi:DUF1572 domain-containing protein [Aequorivita aquimaris]|uniref:DUF1572 domain-containing protein n=1 Tax=Aequorivita aquimaris TaxID=1548749 RepID=UPI001F16404B|nr:DUF1572 domain-containing protein [Aequorivita aquimaris]
MITSINNQQSTINNQPLPKADFEKEYPTNKHSYYKHIHGIIQHDAYHLGQIVLLAKMV